MFIPVGRIAVHVFFVVLSLAFAAVALAPLHDGVLLGELVAFVARILRVIDGGRANTVLNAVYALAYRAEVRRIAARPVAAHVITYLTWLERGSAKDKRNPMSCLCLEALTVENSIASGRPAGGPFPTFIRRTLVHLAPEQIARFAVDHGLSPTVPPSGWGGVIGGYAFASGALVGAFAGSAA